MRFWDYIKGDRRGREANRIERDAMRDPLLHDAIEGFDRTAGDHDAAMERLRARIAERAATGPSSEYIPRGRTVRNWSMAAAAVLVVLTTGTLLYVLDDPAPLPVEAPGLAVFEDSLPTADPLEQSILAAVTEKKEKTAQSALQEETAKVNAIADPLQVVTNDTKISTSVDFAEFCDMEEIALPSPMIAEEAMQPDEVPVPAEEVQSDPTKQLSGRVAGVLVADAKERAAKPFVRIRGRVVEAGTGEPIQGASVVVQGTTTGTMTDKDGFFVFSDAKPNAKISAGFIGYETATLPADTGKEMLIAMNPDTQSLDEVVVVAFGTAKKERFTGSTSAIASTPADTTTTVAFRRYLADELAKLAAGSGPTGSATLQFDIDPQGRPIRISVVSGSSPEAKREARRILLGGPDWERSTGKRRVTIVFRTE